ncbi:carbohydrate kinase family protein [Leucothrix mucor]|uniref:carbohydrate kinase family protein n=1 Tax=Leucothrix mucor TaxID=45248 RepID=UPI0003B46CD8|nr:carbohydrate kinase [Leucothrix mucor]
MFLVCGEALFDVFVDGSIDLTDTRLPLDAVAGGSPFNVAIGLARLGESSGLLTGVSQDFLGQRLMAILENEKVNTDFTIRKAAPSTLSFIQKDEHGVPDYAFYGNGAADRSVLMGDLPTGHSLTGLHLGSYSIVTPPTADTLLSLMQQQPDSCLVSLDPNVRLGVEPNVEIWRERVALIAQRANLLKISDEDYDHLYPDTPVEAKVAEWLALGVGLVAFTQGGKGAQLWSKTGNATVVAPKIVVADTVGAGDTFQTSLIYQLLELRQQNNDWESQLDDSKLKTIGEFAAVAAAITCSRQGADLPTLADVQTALAG